MAPNGRGHLRWIKAALVTGLLAWSAWSAWGLYQARTAGRAIGRAIESHWPATAPAQPGLRGRLAGAARRVGQGDFASAAADLQPVQPTSAQQRAAAQRFFARHTELREQFVALVDQARRAGQDGADVTVARDVLALTIESAARHDRQGVARRLTTAAAALAEPTWAGGMLPGPEAVAARVARIAPAYELGRDLLTEGHTAVAKLVDRAARQYRAQDYARACVLLLDLAGQLLGLPDAPPAATTDKLPTWFAGPAPPATQPTTRAATQPTTRPATQPATAPSPAPIDLPRARAAAELARAMAPPETASAIIADLLARADRALQADQADRAWWWASIALNALGMTDAQIDAATQPAPDVPPDQIQPDQRRRGGPAMSSFSFHMGDFVFVWWGLLYEAMPFVVAGTILSGVVERCVSRETVVRLFPKRRGVGIAVSAGLGLIFPMCECGIVPVVRRLVRKGVPVSCAVTYMLAAPIINPLVITSTLVAFQGRQAGLVTGLRVSMGYMVAVTIGVMVWKVLAERKALRPGAGGVEDDSAEDAHDHQGLRGHVLVDILIHAAQDFLLIGATLVIGTALAALVNSGFHRAAMEPLANNPFSAVGGMSLLAIGLNLCSEADAFVAASFYAFPMAAKMAFLVLGPMVDVKLLVMYTTIFKPRAIVAIAGLTTLLIFVLCVTGYAWMPLLAS